MPDSLPAGLTFVTASATQGSYDLGAGTWVVGYLESGQTETLTIDASVNSGTAGTTITNTAGAVTIASPSDVVGSNNSASVDIFPIIFSFTPDVTIENVAKGSIVCAAHVVVNLGTSPDTYDITAEDPLPTEIASVIFYSDNAPVGTLNLTGTTPDTLFIDTDGDTTPDTGLLAGATSKNMLICYAVATSFSAPAAPTVTSTATSSIQPSATRTVIDTLNIIAVPDLVILKDVQTYSDPINGETNPYFHTRSVRSLSY